MMTKLGRGLFPDRPSWPSHQYVANIESPAGNHGYIFIFYRKKPTAGVKISFNN
jgi:hypothetical protein